MSTLEITSLVLGESTLILFGFCLFLLFKLKQSRLRANKLVNRLRGARAGESAETINLEMPQESANLESEPNHVLAFLRQELAATKSRFQKMSAHEEMAITPEDPMEAHIVALRGAFLEAEYYAAKTNNKDRRYWQRFETILQQIIKSYSNSLADSEENQALQQRLEEALKQLSALEQLEMSYTLANDKLHRAEEEIKLLEKYRQANQNNVNRVKELLGEVEQLRSAPNVTELVVDETPMSPADQEQRLDAITALANEQKQLISFLQGEVDQLKAADADPEDINSLMFQLQESGRCIETLECEVESLRNQLGDSTESDDLGSLIKKADRLQSQLALTKKMAKNSAALVSFARELMPCENHSMLIDSIINAVTRQEATASVLVLDDDKHVLRYTHGEPSAKDKHLLKGLGQSENNRIINHGSNVVINYPMVRMKLELKGCATDDAEQLRDFCVVMCELATMKAELLVESGRTRRQRIALNKLVKTTKQNIKNINVQYKYQGDEGEKIFKDLVEDINLMMSVVDMSPNQALRLEKLLKTARDRFVILYNAKEIVDRGFIDIISRLEKA